LSGKTSDSMQIKEPAAVKNKRFFSAR